MEFALGTFLWGKESRLTTAGLTFVVLGTEGAFVESIGHKRVVVYIHDQVGQPLPITRPKDGIPNHVFVWMCHD